MNYEEKYFKICMVNFTDSRIMASCMVISVLLVIFQYQIFISKKLVSKPVSHLKLQRTNLDCTFPFLLLINLSVSVWFINL
jgi:hypothetical protein